MTSDQVRVVLDNSVTEDELTAIAGQHHWRIRRRFARNGEQPEEYVYTTRDSSTDLHFIQDHKLGVNYILVKGPHTTEIVSVLTANLEYYDADDIREGAKNEMDAEDRRRSLYYLALITMDQGFDPEVFEIYKKAFADLNPIVRGAAVLGSAYLGWPKLAGALRQLASASEPDESIRKDAALLSERLAGLPDAAP
jgi:hypothetical protein